MEPTHVPTQPISDHDLEAIVQDACKLVFADAVHYDHDLACTRWNQEIPKRILSDISAIVNRTTDEIENKPKLKYKFTVNSAIVQHTAPLNQLDPETKEPIRPETIGQTGQAGLSDPTGPSASAGPDHKVTLKQETRGKRGMHMATCAIWNTETDGVFNTKYEPSEGQDWDVIVSIMWLSY